MAILAGKFALVTGGARGIGRAVAERLAWDGAAVAINYKARADRAEAVAGEIRQRGGNAFTVQGDIGNPADVQTLLGTVREKFGALDILVNNAGGGAPRKPIAETDAADFDRAFALAKGTFLALSWAARHLRDGGRIISISTSLTTGFWPNGALYVGYKAAIEQFSRTLSKEIGERGITVNTVSPGPIRTEANSDPANHARMLPQTSVGRLGLPEDVAVAVAFLADPASGFITGQNIAVNGGVR